MIGALLALLAVGVVLIFFLPWVGVPVAIVAAAVILLYIVGFGRRAATGRQP
jgi:hypothetical protein